jgi:HD-GYP domain-containing protein (c-di-GMP phosphodiesterase class II)
MADHPLLQLNLERYGRWWLRLAGDAYPLAVFDSTGAAVWADGGTADSGVVAGVATASADGFAWEGSGDGLRRRDVDGATALLYHPLIASSGVSIGWLALTMARSDADQKPSEVDRLAELLEDISGSLRDEHRLVFELDAMAQELSERYEELHLVYELDKHTRKFEQGRETYQNLVRTCAEQTNVDLVAFLRPSDNLTVSFANLSKPIHNLDLVLVEMRGDLYRFVHSARETVVINDKTDPRRAYIFTDMPYKLLAAPVFRGDIVVAVLVLVNHDYKSDFTNSDRKIAEMTANQLSVMIHMCSMLDEMQDFTEQMAAALIESVEAKDPYTRGHSERVHKISMEIGRALDLPVKELDNLFWGSLLHDVGKIGIPDAVLCKPGRLTRDEYTFIMVHPERSYEILRHIDRLKDAVPGARHHQEKFDGTGYPHGLKGKNIPLHGRIIAVADTYDSITSSRAYRAGRSHEAAMTEIDKVSGTQLDPDIVAVFRQVCAAEPGWIEHFGIKRELPDA